MDPREKEDRRDRHLQRKGADRGRAKSARHHEHDKKNVCAGYAKPFLPDLLHFTKGENVKKVKSENGSL